MTVNKSTTTSSAKTKKKTDTTGATSSTTNVASSSTSSTTKSKSSSKVAASSSSTSTSTSTTKAGVVQTSSTGTLSQYPSGSCLQIADVSHLPVNASVVTYTVTEKLPQETGEKITTYADSGATSTEYVHYVATDSSTFQNQQASNITQISSTLNRSTSNLSTLTDDSSATYTVLEPKEETKFVGKNDSAWNGKFVYETPRKTIAKGDKNTVEEHFSSSSTKQQSSSAQKSSSSSYVYEIVDGKERLVDQKHHESGSSKASSKEEHLASKTGTHITPELHYTEKGQKTSSGYDTNLPELQQPKSSSSEYGREFHKVGDQESKSSYKTRDNKALVDNTKTTLSQLEDSKLLTTSSTATKEQADSSSSRKNVDLSSSKVVEGPTSTTTTTTTTYYDASGNVVKTDTLVDNKITDGRQFYNVDDASSTKTLLDKTYHVGEQTSKLNDQMKSSTSNFYSTSDVHVKDDRKTFLDTTVHQDDDASSSKTYYVGERGSKQPKDHQLTSTTSNFYSTDDTQIKDDATSIKTTRTTNLTQDDDASSSKTYYVGERSKPKDHQMKSTTSNFYSTNDVQIKDDASSTGTYIIDDQHVDTSKARNAQTTTDSRNFYGHGMDSSRTMVSNVYDTNAVQNTIGTRGKILKDHTMTDTKDVVFSNERNYGKTGWNGQFTYETPQKPTQTRSPERKTPSGKSPDRKTSSPERKTPQGKSPAGEVSSKKSPEQKTPQGKSPVDRKPESPTRKGSRPKDVSSAFIESETVDNYVTDSKTSVTKDSKSFIDHELTSSDIRRKPSDVDRKQEPTHPTNGVSVQNVTDFSTNVTTNITDFSTKTDFSTNVTKDTRQFLDDKSIIVETIIKDGKPMKITRRRDELDHRHPAEVTDSKTVIESYETVTNKSDFKTTLIKDSQTFVDNQSTFEHYQTSDKYDSSVDGPRGPKDGPQGPKDGPRGIKEGPREPKDGPQGPRGIKDGPRGPKDGPRGPRDTKEGSILPKELFPKDSFDVVKTFTNTDVRKSITEDFRSSETIVDRKNVESYLVSDTRKDETVRVKDVRNLDVVDRVHINETIVDIKDIVSKQSCVVIQAQFFVDLTFYLLF